MRCSRPGLVLTGRSSSPRAVTAGAPVEDSDWRRAGPAVGGRRAGPGCRRYRAQGRIVVTVGQRGTIRLWTVPSGKPLGNPIKYTSGTDGYASFSQTGATHLPVGEGATVWYVGTTLQPKGPPLKGQYPNTITHAALSGDGDYVVTAGSDGNARRWRAYSGSARRARQ